jgi:hypothetical protein
MVRRNVEIHYHYHSAFPQSPAKCRGVDKFVKTLAKLTSSSVFSLAQSENNWPSQKTTGPVRKQLAQSENNWPSQKTTGPVRKQLAQSENNLPNLQKLSEKGKKNPYQTGE